MSNTEALRDVIGDAQWFTDHINCALNPPGASGLIRRLLAELEVLRASTAGNEGDPAAKEELVAWRREYAVLERICDADKNTIERLLAEQAADGEVKESLRLEVQRLRDRLHETRADLVGLRAKIEALADDMERRAALELEHWTDNGDRSCLGHKLGYESSAQRIRELMAQS